MIRSFFFQIIICVKTLITELKKKKKKKKKDELLNIFALCILIAYLEEKEKKTFFDFFFSIHFFKKLKMAQRMIDLKIEEYTLHKQNKKLHMLRKYMHSRNANLKIKKAFKKPLETASLGSEPNSKALTSSQSCFLKPSLTDGDIKTDAEPVAKLVKDFFLSLSSSKHVTLKYSKYYRDIVLALNINSSKSFIITKQMWLTLRKHINYIDKELSKLPLTTAKNVQEHKKPDKLASKKNRSDFSK